MSPYRQSGRVEEVVVRGRVGNRVDFPGWGPGRVIMESRFGLVLIQFDAGYRAFWEVYA